MRSALLPLLLTLPAAAGNDVVREPFANARVSYMARVQTAGSEVRLAELDLWAEGGRLRLGVRGDSRAGEFWVEGLSPRATRIVDGKVDPARPRTMEHALEVAFAASAVLPHANTDRIAGRPCKLSSETVAGGATLTRCIWKGLPLSVELKAKGFSFHAAATLVEEGAATPADLQPPAGWLSAGR